MFGYLTNTLNKAFFARYCYNSTPCLKKDKSSNFLMLEK